MHRQKRLKDLSLAHIQIQRDEEEKKTHQQPNAILQVDRFTEVKPKKKCEQ